MDSMHCRLTDGDRFIGMHVAFKSLKGMYNRWIALTETSIASFAISLEFCPHIYIIGVIKTY